MTYQIIVAADGDDGTREIVRELGATNSALLAIGNESVRGRSRRQSHFVSNALTETGRPFGFLWRLALCGN